MSNENFLGRGMKFPPQIDAGTGRFALSSGAQSVKESVYLILMTQQGERWLEPDFGSRILSYTFMDTSPTMITLLVNELRSLLLEQEPRISEVQIELDPSSREGCLVFNLGYTITATNTRDNLVFPFYLNPGEEEDNAGVQ
ncbi:MAG TPA: GPW/gp25 family protein [Candidatus Caccousia avistercoris]|nr:GPW/gp25 family protein [Candidatus Caccousia avistercoris]